MMHKKELLKDWRLCREKAPPAKSSRCHDWRLLVYWDVVEVIPEPDYCLFVRFKDGSNGRVQLRFEELTGALAPLRDVQFFGRIH
jgi:hypothetical protein